VIRDRLVARKDDSPKSRAFALWGIAGQGKTQTALHFTQANLKSFSYIFWVTADCEERILQGYHDCAVAAGLRQPSADITASAVAFTKFLSASGKSAK
jgi:hypothetical protein